MFVSLTGSNSLCWTLFTMQIKVFKKVNRNDLLSDRMCCIQKKLDNLRKNLRLFSLSCKSYASFLSFYFDLSKAELEKESSSYDTKYIDASRYRDISLRCSFLKV